MRQVPEEPTTGRGSVRCDRYFYAMIGRSVYLVPFPDPSLLHGQEKMLQMMGRAEKAGRSGSRDPEETLLFKTKVAVKDYRPQIG